MKNKGLAVIIVLVVAIVGVGAYFLMPKNTPAPVAPKAPEKKEMKKVDLSTQPEWVQKLKVSLKSGKSANGLNNFTFKIENIPSTTISTVSYEVQYETVKYGTQGSLSFTPIDIAGKSDYSKTIDLGTCSTKSCVRHDGVTSVDLQFTFTTTSGDTGIWTGSLPL